MVLILLKRSVHKTRTKDKQKLKHKTEIITYKKDGH